MKLTLLRHATLLLEYGGLRLLVDPMLSTAGALDPVANAGNERRIPLVELPLSPAALVELIASLDAVLLTHSHRDHWDAAAQQMLPRELTILCQPVDEAKLKQAGFTQAQAVEDSVLWRGVILHRTGGEHGTGEIGKRMGQVSGFILQADGEPALYIAGDTIWCPAVDQALKAFSPQMVVINAGEARFLQGDAITMSAADVAQVCRAAPDAQVVAVHFETVNHCRLSRAALQEFLAAEGLQEQVRIPADGEMLEFVNNAG
jgi:L-ascorbate metabolism protein UlaG (beta-lactamase superfamily)